MFLRILLFPSGRRKGLALARSEEGDSSRNVVEKTMAELGRRRGRSPQEVPPTGRDLRSQGEPISPVDFKGKKQPINSPSNKRDSHRLASPKKRGFITGGGGNFTFYGRPTCTQGKKKGDKKESPKEGGLQRTRVIIAPDGAFRKKRRKVAYEKGLIREKEGRNRVPLYARGGLHCELR